jgi:hypothetical protein
MSFEFSTRKAGRKIDGKKMKKNQRCIFLPSIFLPQSVSERNDRNMDDMKMGKPSVGVFLLSIFLSLAEPAA